MMTVEQSIALAKRQILADIRDGLVPSTVSSFAELHDYVDANEYGELCGTVYAERRGDSDGMPDDLIDFANTVQNAVHLWLNAGRPE